MMPYEVINSYFKIIFMAYWNHFSKYKHSRIKFSDLNIGDKFRNDFHDGNRRRKDIICIKIGSLLYIEERNKKEHSLFSSENYEVSSFL